MAYTLKPYQAQVATTSGFDALLAAWLIVSPFLVGFGYSAAAVTNNIVCGGVALILAIPRFMGSYREAWMSWIDCVIGVWVLISPWALGFAHNRGAMMNNLLTGIAMAALACWSALAHVSAGGESRQT